MSNADEEQIYFTMTKIVLGDHTQKKYSVKNNT